MSKRGLPDIAARCATTSTTSRRWPARPARPIGRLVPIEQIDPNPNQPRQVMGDLSELMASIAEKGIIEPLVVRQRGDRFQIIAGERRYQAAGPGRPARAAGRHPRRRRHRDHRARAGREPPAEGPDAVRRSRGAARPRRALRLHARGPGASGWGSRGRRSPSRWRSPSMPDEVRNLCRLADISSKSLLLQVVRQQTPEKMIALIEQLTREGRQGGPTREQARKVTAKPKPGRPKSFVFRYRPPTKTFNLSSSSRGATSIGPKSSRRSRPSSRSCAKGNSETGLRRTHPVLLRSRADDQPRNILSSPPSVAASPRTPIRKGRRAPRIQAALADRIIGPLVSRPGA